ncbi:hypothetical protein Y032_0343g3051 [Ancylostoma ceylanicum]|uniref:Uncharacterized protein n=1 Tax=Ancylostoma ceylanicum TaxID=53326 RepID=A0A016RXT0_9BILA|nr:hypothetical protein Y032_0343g3051 [Ancylostoma ceylanicum]
MDIYMPWSLRRVSHNDRSSSSNSCGSNRGAAHIVWRFLLLKCLRSFVRFVVVFCSSSLFKARCYHSIRKVYRLGQRTFSVNDLGIQISKMCGQVAGDINLAKQRADSIIATKMWWFGGSMVLQLLPIMPTTYRRKI